MLSTFHQVKGLERKVVIIMSFDASQNHQDDPVLYVASTRAEERLSLIHDER